MKRLILIEVEVSDESEAEHIRLALTDKATRAMLSVMGLLMTVPHERRAEVVREAASRLGIDLDGLERTLSETGQ